MVRERPRRAYSQVASDAEEEAADIEAAAGTAEPAVAAAANATVTTTTAPRPSSSRNYSRVALDDDAAATEEEDEDAAASDRTANSSSQLTLSSTTPSLEDEDDEDDKPDDGRRITVTVLDFAQSKFRVSVNPAWTVAKFKTMGSKIHKVAPAQQRLIFRGKLLSDEQTLEESGIVDPDTIIHLFPKPRVVITNKNDDDDESAAAEAATDDDTAAAAAHVPTIVMDEQEAAQRSQILVLGSADYMEAQNNVKLFSFMLLVISTIELLNLTAIAMGVPQNDNAAFGMQDDIVPPPEDDYNNNETSGGNSYHDPAVDILQTWGPLNYVDLFLSLAGIYVALTGMKAANMNELLTARIYLCGTAVVGVGWLLFNYFMSVKIDQEIEEQREQEHGSDDVLYPKMSDSDIYTAALQVMILPAMVWILCCLRAWQFQSLLADAEAEAEERLESQMNYDDDNHGNDGATANEQRLEDEQNVMAFYNVGIV